MILIGSVFCHMDCFHANGHGPFIFCSRKPENKQVDFDCHIVNYLLKLLQPYVEILP